MKLIQHAKSLDSLTRRGFEPAALGDLMAGPKKQWVNSVEAIATEKHPEWRQQFEKTDKGDKRLHPEQHG